MIWLYLPYNYFAETFARKITLCKRIVFITGKQFLIIIFRSNNVIKMEKIFYDGKILIIV